MAFQTDFIEMPLSELHFTAERMKEQGSRFVQTHCVTGVDGIDIYYTYMVNGALVSYRVSEVLKGTPVPSITDVFPAAFVFENEAAELFGVDMRNISIDFHGGLYAPAVAEPMTILSPAQVKAREKERARRVEEAQVRAQGQAQVEAQEAPAGEQLQEAAPAAPGVADALEEKLAGMDPEKAAKVRAAMAAKAAREAAKQAEAQEKGE